MFYCYLLCTDSGSHTYVGATTDPDRRLRQHKGELAGGARATGIRVAQGREWRRVCVLHGLPDWKSALQVEWRWKQLSRTRFASGPPLERRLRALHCLLEMEKPTEKAIPYEMYPSGPPRVVWDAEEYETLSHRLQGR